MSKSPVVDRHCGNQQHNGWSAAQQPKYIVRQTRRKQGRLRYGADQGPVVEHSLAACQCWIDQKHGTKARCRVEILTKETLRRADRA